MTDQAKIFYEKLAKEDVRAKEVYEKLVKEEERAQPIFEAAVARYGAYEPTYPPRLWVGYLPDAIEYVEAVPECGMSPMEMAETMLEDSYRSE